MLAMYFPENAGFQYWQTITHICLCTEDTHIFSICLLCTFWIGVREHLVARSFYSLYILWFRCSITHTRNKLLLFQ
jgi:hypothetical protein